MSSSLPDLDQDVIAAIFVELSQMDVELDLDPLEHGPRRLRQKVAETRHIRSRCEVLFHRIARMVYEYKRHHRLTKTDLEVKRQRLLAEDFEVRSGPSVADREARATVKLAAEVAEEARLQSSLAELEAVMTVIKAKRSDLMDIRTQLKSQERLCLEEIANLNGQWGSKPPPGKGFDLSQGGPAVQNPDELDEFLGGLLGGETHLPQLDDEVGEDSEEEEDLTEEAEEEEAPATEATEEEEEDLLDALLSQDDEEAEAELEVLLDKEIDPLPPEKVKGPEEPREEVPDEGEVVSLDDEAASPDKDILLGTASEEDVESFLEGEMPQPKPKKWGPDDGDLDIDALWSSFQD